MTKARGNSDDLVIGVMGGMGPEATTDFFSKLIAATDAESDQDHLRILIDNNPKIPNRHRAIRGETPSVGPALAEMAKGLETAGADFIVMACNTAHAFQEDIEGALTVPFVSMVDETVSHIAEAHAGMGKVGLMAADGCLEAGLYQKALSDRGLEAVQWGDRELARFMELVFEIKAGRHTAATARAMAALTEPLIAQGAQIIISGCTEIPLVLDEDKVPVPIVSSTDLLVERCIDYARRRLPLPA